MLLNNRFDIDTVISRGQSYWPEAEGRGLIPLHENKEQCQYPIYYLMKILLHNYYLFQRLNFKRIFHLNMLCQYFSDNFTSEQLHEMSTQNVS